jgi:peptidoglycan/xylan/chitin deacetylase (PgdA/CDA1 family)
MLRETIARLRPRDPLILLYHRVTHLANDRWSIAVTPAHFAEQMEVLHRRATALPLSALGDSVTRPNARAARVVVTFDDGYADNLHEALPILQRFDVPATVFVATDAVVRSREFWWDDLERLVAPSDYDAVWARLRDVGGREREGALDALRDAAGVGSAPRPEKRPLTPDELACLARGVRIAIGAHTASHARLAALTGAEQRADIETGLKAAESIIGRRIESFAYPFGRAGDYTAETMAIVREAGFTRACSNQAGRVDRSTDRYALPRLYVRDWNGDEFAAALNDLGLRV